ncbi:hypothetical protein BP5796_12949 [Coleophoma crateriformis]|uniref:Uncharacterized protein n=1 Tax=Coleophoma crateriformis TaxID=565419 RepID=A0A3D8Q4Z8_9HELO|nr:hypothetical protein BP5796_12949 [Coleophoma crateriformis]
MRGKLNGSPLTITSVRANAIQAQHNVSRKGFSQSCNRGGDSSPPRETAYVHYNDSVQLPEEYEDLAVDYGILCSTNTAWGFENAGANDFHDGSAWAVDLDASGSTSGTTSGAFRLNQDDALCSTPILRPLEVSTSDSTPEIGSLESVPDIFISRPSLFDNELGHNDHGSISFDDFINFELSEPSSATVPTTTHSPRSSIVLNESLLRDLQSSHSPSPSQQLHPQESPEASLLASNLVLKRSSPNPALKLAMAPSSSLKCPICLKSLAFESRLRYICKNPTWKRY